MENNVNVCEPEVQSVSIPRNRKIPTEEKKSRKKLFIIIGAIILLFAIAVTVCIILLNGALGGNNTNFALYVKDSEIYYYEISKDFSTQISSDLLRDSDLENPEKLATETILSSYAYVSENGKFIFYPDRVDSFSPYDNSNIFSLYFREINNPDKEPVKIDSNVTRFHVNEQNGCVIYLKNSDNKNSLYIYFIKNDDKQKIANNVQDFELSEDGNKILYINDEGSMYLKQGGNDPEKITNDLDIYSLYNSLAYNKNFSSIYYIKEGSLYVKKENAEPEKIASDVNSLITTKAETNGIYYLKKEGDPKLSDFITDDMKEEDAEAENMALTVQDGDLISYTYKFDNIDGLPEDYSEPYDGYLSQEHTVNNYTVSASEEEFFEERFLIGRKQGETFTTTATNDGITVTVTCTINEIKYKKTNYDLDNRNQLRTELAEATFSPYYYTLNYYDGTEDKKILDSVRVESSAESSSLLAVKKFDTENANKIKLSEISSVSSAETQIRDALDSSVSYNIIIDDTVSELGTTTAYHFIISNDGKSIYFLDDANTDKGDIYNIYKISVKKDSTLIPELYDTDVNCSYYSTPTLTPDNKHIIYFKDIGKDVNDSGKGDLYIDKKSIDYDVNTGTISYQAKTDSFFYLADINNNQAGTLKTYSGDKPKRIADDVTFFAITPANDILYLTDYSSKYFKGDLRIYRNGEYRKIDDDVQMIIPVKNDKNDILPILVGKFNLW